MLYKNIEFPKSFDMLEGIFTPEWVYSRAIKTVWENMLEIVETGKLDKLIDMNLRMEDDFFTLDGLENIAGSLIYMSCHGLEYMIPAVELDLGVLKRYCWKYLTGNKDKEMEEYVQRNMVLLCE